MTSIYPLSNEQLVIVVNTRIPGPAFFITFALFLKFLEKQITG